MTDRLRVDEFADVLVGQVGEGVDDPIPESPLSPRVFGLPEFAYSERIAPRYALLLDDDPPPTILRRGDVVVGLAGQYLGNTMSVFTRFDGAILGRDCALIRVKDEDIVHSEWVYAWSRTQDFRRQVLREVVGATIQRLTPRGLRTLSLPLFPLKDQERIGSVAGAFDDALDAARLTVSDLEELRDRQLDVELYHRLEEDDRDPEAQERAARAGVRRRA